MERGYINITENDNHEFTVEAKLVKGTLWLSVWEMATLFNVYTKTIEGSLKAIFKTGLLKEDEVTRLHKFTLNGKTYEVLLYNLEAIIHIGFRVSSFEGKAFRDWVSGGFSEYLKMGKIQSSKVLIVLNGDSKTPLIASLN